MAKKKQKKQQGGGGGQQFLSPEKFVRQRMRSLPIGKCYITDNSASEGGGVYHIVVTRQHTGGRVSAALFLVDMYCLGVEDSFFRLRLEPEELADLLDTEGASFGYRECSYEEAHNRIYGAVAFAEDGGIKADKSFLLTQYFLEEDTDDVPFIEYEYGLRGKHFLVCKSQLEASRYLPALRQTLGENGFECVVDGEVYDNDAYEEDGLLPPGPVEMSELVRSIGYDDLYSYAETLHLDIADGLSLKALRQAYTEAVLSQPQLVLSQLCREDLGRLKELGDNPEWGDDVPYYQECLTPLMVYYGFAQEGWKDDTHYVVRIASDFRQAVSPHIDEAINSKVNMVRLMIESIVEGLANLYGEVNRKDAVSFLKEHLLIDHKLDIEAVFDFAWQYSMQLDWMMLPVEDYDGPDSNVPDEKIIFCSRYGWDDDEAFRRATAQQSSHVMHRHPFGEEEVIAAARAPLPLIPNKRQDAFADFLVKRLKFSQSEVDIVCYCLWLRAQHEGDEDYEDETWQEFFDKVVLAEADDKLKAEAMKELNAYMDCMPRWTLKGYAPCEV